MHPFSVPHRSFEDRSALRDRLTEYDTLLDGAGVSFSDLAHLKDIEKIRLPYSLMEASSTFRSFQVLLHAMLGGQHPLVHSFDNFLQRWTTSELFVASQLANIPLACAESANG